MKKLEEYSQEVADWFVPVIGDGEKFTETDLLKLHAICALAALEAKAQETDYEPKTWTFSEAAGSMGVMGFDGYPELDHDNTDAAYYDAWWASDFTSNDWLAFAAWCRDMINALPSSAF